MDVQKPPPQNAARIYDMIGERSGNEDPFREIKRQSTLHCLSLYQKLKRSVARSADPLEAAVRYAACGNVIDYGVGSTYDILGEIDTILEQAFHVWEFELFKSRLEEASFVLYLGDNCGETVFDRILIETMGKPVTFVVRGGSIINDVTLEDARQAGLDRVSTVISSGCRAPGTIPEWTSEEFSRLYESAPLIISKGQGNFETLSDESREIFFLFKIKCRVVADYIRCPMSNMFFGRSFV
jgi:uncharacterized protein with ATP-grasp and redox domains